MSYWILTNTAEIVSRTTVQHITNLEKRTDEMQNRMEHFMLSTTALLQTQSQDVPIPPDTNPWLRLTRNDDPEMTSYLTGRDSLWLLNQEVYDDKSGQPTGDLEDNYVNMEIALPRGDDGQLQHARVKRRAIDQDGKPIGKAADNPMLDTRKYIVQYLDGTVETLTANTIATNLFAQVDEDGHRQLFIDDIVAHRCDESAIKIENGTYKTATGVPRKKRTTCGWYFCIQAMGGWVYRLGTPQGHKRFLPSTSSGVRAGTQAGRRTRVCLVGSLHDKEADQHHREIENQILAKITQIRNSHTEKYP